MKQFDQRQDLTDYSDQELSLLVFNDEYLYTRRHSRGFKELIDSLFSYNIDQWQVLEQDLKDDLEEI